VFKTIKFCIESFHQTPGECPLFFYEKTNHIENTKN